MQLTDAQTRYGWSSIALHWAGAVSVVMMWLIGHVMTLASTGETEKAELVHVHTSVAVTIFILLVGRIAHRLVMGFPGRTLDQKPVSFLLTRLLQYALLLGIATMLISGPLMVWANGDGIEVFNWGQIPSPFEPNATLYELMLQIHRTTRWALMIGVLAHVVGVFRSPAETLNRMLLAPETLQHGSDSKAD